MIGKIVLSVAVLMICAACSPKRKQSNSLTVGQQEWTTTNLDVATFRNGDPIPEAKTVEQWKLAGENAQPAWCYYENDPSNNTSHGKLYNWFAASDPRISPPGWHVPTREEWEKLQGANAGDLFQTKSGFRHVAGNFRMRDSVGYWWTASETPPKVTAFHRQSDDPLPRESNSGKGSGLSVRLVRD